MRIDRTSLRVLVLGVAVAVAAGACGGGAVASVAPTFRASDATTPSPTAVPASPTAEAQKSLEPAPTAVPGGPTASVDIFDNGFSRADLGVTVGTTVTWTNTGRRAHTVTGRDGSFGGDVVGSSATFAHTFTTSGTFPYICTIHSDMSGTITVTP
jgi:plastocyanin